jgi:hypothetical protein
MLGEIHEIHGACRPATLKMSEEVSGMRYLVVEKGNGPVVF